MIVLEIERSCQPEVVSGMETSLGCFGPHEDDDPPAPPRLTVVQQANEIIARQTSGCKSLSHLPGCIFTGLTSHRLTRIRSFKAGK
jgi:hypothetical protein